MTFHLFGAVLTPEGVASNNRGENAGNVSTLQKILRAGETYSTVSAEAIRFAIRQLWSAEGEEMNRFVDLNGESQWKDTTFSKWAANLDDDVMGFMDAKKETVKRRGRLEITRALSTRPWTGDVMFNVASPGAQPIGNPNPVPYAIEVHCTRYQFAFGLTPTSLEDPKRTLSILDAFQNLRGVAGNHGRYLYQFAPEAIVLRWTEDPVPRLLYCFQEDEDGTVRADKIVTSIRAGDLDASELVVGGEPLAQYADEFQSLGVEIHAGVKGAFSAIHQRVEAAF